MFTGIIIVSGTMKLARYAEAGFEYAVLDNHHLVCILGDLAGSLLPVRVHLVDHPYLASVRNCGDDFFISNLLLGPGAERAGHVRA